MSVCPECNSCGLSDDLGSLLRLLRDACLFSTTLLTGKRAGRADVQPRAQPPRARQGPPLVRFSAQPSNATHKKCSRQAKKVDECEPLPRGVLDEFFYRVVDRNKFELPSNCPFKRSKAWVVLRTSTRPTMNLLPLPLPCASAWAFRGVIENNYSTEGQSTPPPP